MSADVMSLEETVVEKLRQLPPDKQLEVRDFVEFLHLRVLPKQPRQSLEGLWKGLISTPITSEDIDEARREMWSDFPREDI